MHWTEKNMDIRYLTPCHSEERSDEESLDTRPEGRQRKKFKAVFLSVRESKIRLRPGRLT
jgi:hypothetical protein